MIMVQDLIEIAPVNEHGSDAHINKKSPGFHLGSLIILPTYPWERWGT